MTPFTFSKAQSVEQALQAARAGGAKFLGGGTNLVDLMHEGIEQPAALVDVTALSTGVALREDGSLRVGAGVRNTALAEHAAVRAHFPLLSRAISAGASPQIRNMATVAGNLLQRTRCVYFYDRAGSRCNRRTPGQGCDALEGFNRMHAILGVSPACIATHPSDLCVALVAYDALVHVASVHGNRVLPLTELHREPGEHPERETTLEPGELITAIEIPPLPFEARQSYTKVRDRASYAFALVSVAAAVSLEGDRILEARLAFGGIASRPWRALRAETSLRGQPASAASFRAAADAELAAATPHAGNAFKVELTRRTLVSALTQLTRSS